MGTKWGHWGRGQDRGGDRGEDKALVGIGQLWGPRTVMRTGMVTGVRTEHLPG